MWPALADSKAVLAEAVLSFQKRKNDHTHNWDSNNANKCASSLEIGRDSPTADSQH